MTLQELLTKVERTFDPSEAQLPEATAMNRAYSVNCTVSDLFAGTLEGSNKITLVG